MVRIRVVLLTREFARDKRSVSFHAQPSRVIEDSYSPGVACFDAHDYYLKVQYDAMDHRVTKKSSQGAAAAVVGVGTGF